MLARGKAVVKSLLYFVLYYTGIEFLLTRTVSVNAAAVLMYHGVTDSSFMPPHIDFHIPVGIFRRHLRFLRRRYQVVPLSRLLEKLASGERLNKEIVLTFDDGYRNNYLHAAPLLRQYGMSAAAFLTTDYIGTSQWLPLNDLYMLWAAGEFSNPEVQAKRERIRLSPMEETSDLVAEVRARSARLNRAPAADSFDMMSWDEVRQLAADGMEIGSHSCSHISTSAENEDVQRRELQVSRQSIEAQLGMPCRLFAYPYGRPPYIDHKSARLVRECGYSCAVTTEYGLVSPSTDPFRIPRAGYGRRQLFFFAGELLYLFLRRRLGRPGSPTISHG